MSQTVAKEKRNKQTVEVNAAAPANVPEPQGVPAERGKVARIAVRPKHYAILQVIFGYGRNGQIYFLDFRKAMEAVGYDMQIPLTGSRWLFKHKELPSFEAHYKHGSEDRKMLPATLNAIASHLRKTLGWTLGTFVVSR